MHLNTRWIPYLFFALFIAIMFFLLYQNRAYTFPNERNVIILSRNEPELIDGTLVNIRGVTNKIITNKYGITTFTIQTDWGSFYEIVCFPALGTIPSIKRGDLIAVEGTISQYKSKMQIEPTAKEHISIIGKVMLQESRQTVPLIALKNHMNETVLIGPVTVYNLEKKKTKKSGFNLQFLVKQEEIGINGVMFDGDWNSADWEALNEGNSLYMTVKVTEFNHNISLTLKRIEGN